MKTWQIIILIVFFLFVMVAFGKPKNMDKIKSITGDKMKIRDCDPAGCGYFGAHRIGHIHKGIDVIVSPGQKIFAPISGTIRKLWVYPNSNQMRGVEISGGDTGIKIFYLDSVLATGDKVKSGDYIGIAQDVAAYHHSPDMTPHVHVEVRKNGKLLDPEVYFKNVIV